MMSRQCHNPTKATKKETGFPTKTRVEAGFLLLLFFSLKRKEEEKHQVTFQPQSRPTAPAGFPGW
jgi:hypothetical protein